jgi:hypothetical protein
MWGAQEAFKKLRPLLRSVANAFPAAQAEVWAPIGQRPVASVQHRYQWR